MMMQFLTATLGKSNEEISAILFKKGDDGALTDQINEGAFETLETRTAIFYTTMSFAPYCAAL